MSLAVFMVGSIPNSAFAKHIQKYVIQEASLVFRYPSIIALESAATIPLATITAALGLSREMGLPLPLVEYSFSFKQAALVSDNIPFN